MTGNYFLDGFMAELEKEASHPLFRTVGGSQSLLGRKVRGMVSKVEDLGQRTKFRMKKKAEESSDKAGKTIKKILEEAEGDERARVVEGEGGQVLEQGAEDTKYGGGLGNLGKKRAPSFTDKVNPTDMPGAFGKKAEMEKCSKCAGKGCPHCNGKGVHEKQAKAMCGPKYGCGKGMHGTGCGLRKKAGEGVKVAVSLKWIRDRAAAGAKSRSLQGGSERRSLGAVRLRQHDRINDLSKQIKKTEKKKGGILASLSDKRYANLQRRGFDLEKEKAKRNALVAGTWRGDAQGNFGGIFDRVLGKK